MAVFQSIYWNTIKTCDAWSLFTTVLRGGTNKSELPRSRGYYDRTHILKKVGHAATGFTRPGSEKEALNKRRVNTAKIRSFKQQRTCHENAGVVSALFVKDILYISLLFPSVFDEKSNN